MPSAPWINSQPDSEYKYGIDIGLRAVIICTGRHKGGDATAPLRPAPPWTVLNPQCVCPPPYGRSSPVHSSIPLLGGSCRDPLGPPLFHALAGSSRACPSALSPYLARLSSPRPIALTERSGAYLELNQEQVGGLRVSAGKGRHCLVSGGSQQHKESGRSPAPPSYP